MDKLIRKYKIKIGLLTNAYTKHNVEKHTIMRIVIKIKLYKEFIKELENLKETGESNE